MMLSVVLFAALAANPLVNPALLHVKVAEPPKHAALELVKGGVPQFVILSDKVPEKDMTYKLASRQCIGPAVRALKRYVEQATGGTVVEDDVRNAAKYAGKLRFLVGESALTRELGLFAEKQEREGYTLTTFEGGVAIVGNDSSLMKDYYREPQRIWRRGERRATLFGVYDFLERFLGCRFYYPGPDGTIVPEVKDLALAPCRYSDRPHIHGRGGCYMNWNWAKTKETIGSDFPYGDMETFRNSMRWGDSDPFPTAHSPHPEPYAKANPQDIETCFLRNNQGHLYQSVNSHAANYFDYTNLEAADRFVESLKRFYASGGKDEQGWRCVSGYRIPIGQCDTERPLPEMQELPVVKKLGLITEENLKLGQTGWYADIYGRFNQYISRRIKEEFPEQRVTFIGYNSYTWPPRQKKYRPLADNCDVSLAFRDMPRFFRNPKKRGECEELLRDWRDWMNGYPVQGLWCYNGGNSCFVHAVANGFLGEMIRGFGDNLGRLSVFPEFQMHGNALQGKYITQLLFYYQSYAGMRMLWDPDFDHHACYAELWRLMYGEEAARHLDALYATLERAFEKFALPTANQKALYPMTVLDEIERELNAVEALVKDDPVRKRRFDLIALPLRYELKIQRLEHTTVKPVAYALRADGEAWRAAPSVPFVDPHGSGNAPCVEPSLRLGWTKEGLKGVLETSFKPKTDGDFWQCDVVEVFLSPGEKKEWYCQLCFDPNNRISCRCQTLLPIAGAANCEWSPEGMTHTAVKTEKGWRLEFFVPFKSLNAASTPAPYSRWKFACVYNSCEPRGMAATAALRMENHNPDRWGDVKFLGAGDSAPAAKAEPAKVALRGGMLPYAFELSPDMRLTLSEPRFSFGFGRQGANFLNLRVDGLWLSSCVSDGTPFAVTRTKSGGERATRVFNVDGRRFLIGFETKPDSPLLHVAVKPLADGKPWREATVRLNCVPSVMEGQQGYKGVTYARYAKTAMRRVEADAKIEFTSEDRYVCLGDGNYDGSGERKGFGPSYIRLPSDWSGLKSVTLGLRNYYSQSVDFQLAPDSKGVSFAIHQPMSEMTLEKVLATVGEDK